MQSIICPNCKRSIEISEAVRAQLESDVLDAERQRHRQELADAMKQTSAKMRQEMEALKENLARKDKRVKAAEAAELLIRKEKNLLEDQKREFELEKQRQIDREREKIREKATEELTEQYRLKEKEKDQVILQLKKAVEDMKRKAEQGSQQLQGEVQELDLEITFSRAFPDDLIEPIGKGVMGADIRQTVRTRRGTVCGTILWESKRTKAWSDGWVSKLKNDLLSDKANIPAIVSEALPETAHSGMGVINGVYVASPKLAVMLATLLRRQLIEKARERVIAGQKQSKAEQLYAYVTGHDFQHRVEAMIEIYRQMQEQIHKERTAYERSWKQREIQVERLLTGVANMYGSMQGVVDRALPTIKGLDLSDTDTEDISDGQSRLIE